MSPRPLFDLHRRQIRLAFSNNLRTLRLRMGLTQLELATRCGLHRSTINRIENAQDDVTPLFDDACVIADALGVDVGTMRHDLSAPSPKSE